MWALLCLLSNIMLSFLTRDLILHWHSKQNYKGQMRHWESISEYSSHHQ
jgi:hypothetical protein